MFQNPTVAGMAASAGASNNDSEPEATTPFGLVSDLDRLKLPPDAEDAYPLTRLQLGMFFHNELNPASAVYHDVFSFRVQSALDPAKLKRCLDRLAERHPILRTSFHLADFSEPMQIVHRQASVPFEVEDLSALPAADQDRKLVEFIEIEKRRPFDRTVAPLLRFFAQRRGDRTVFRSLSAFIIRASMAGVSRP